MIVLAGTRHFLGIWDSKLSSCTKTEAESDVLLIARIHINLVRARSRNIKALSFRVCLRSHVTLRLLSTFLRVLWIEEIEVTQKFVLCTSLRRFSCSLFTASCESALFRGWLRENAVCR